MISVDRVYQKVLAISNKEQRGYITPQEFNLFAAQAQMEIFEQYFYDINQWSRQPGNSHAHADMLELLEQKVNHFKVYDVSVTVPSISGDIDYNNNEVYRLGEVKIRYNSQGQNKKVTAEEIKVEEHQLYLDSPLAKQSIRRPIYWQRATALGGEVRIRIYPKTTPGDTVLLSYIRKPNDPNWPYMVATTVPGSTSALYDPTSPTLRHFELHGSEETELVNRILSYAGIAIQRPEITQGAAAIELSKTQQEKQ
jgi:hypothetical protein